LAIEELSEITTAPNRVSATDKEHRFLFLIIIVDLVLIASRIL
jgi:hypothetical protein